MCSFGTVHADALQAGIQDQFYHILTAFWLATRPDNRGEALLKTSEVSACDECELSNLMKVQNLCHVMMAVQQEIDPPLEPKVKTFVFWPAREGCYSVIPIRYTYSVVEN